MPLHLAPTPAANTPLETASLALLVGMLVDQPMLNDRVNAGRRA
jgi:hypothetical protein